jgi:hypothetical protein
MDREPFGTEKRTTAEDHHNATEQGDARSDRQEGHDQYQLVEHRHLRTVLFDATARDDASFRNF